MKELHLFIKPCQLFTLYNWNEHFGYLAAET
jgi:hypothetical protein